MECLEIVDLRDNPPPLDSTEVEVHSGVGETMKRAHGKWREVIKLFLHGTTKVLLMSRDVHYEIVKSFKLPHPATSTCG
jgi:hypothetical protein